MSRLRVRNAAGTKWIDICQSEWYMRNPSNTGWERFTPNQGIKARHGTENYWLDIDCIAETDNCEADEYGGTKDGTGTNGSGSPNGDTSGNPIPGGDPTGGSGSGGSGGSGSGPNSGESPLYNNDDLGSGQGGTGYTPGAPYPDGFDLPDSDGDGAGWNGSCYYRPGLNTCEPRVDLVVRVDKDCGTSKAGSFDCPFVCPDTVIGNGPGISEFYIDLGNVSGPVLLPYSANPGAASFDVYYRGKIVATTKGKRSGQDALAFVFNPVANDRILFVRVRATNPSTRWTFQLKCVGDNNLDGSLKDPRPCHGTFEPKNAGGTGVFEFFHDMGSKAGEVDIHYQMWSQPDKLEVYNNAGKLVKSTGGYVAGEGHVKFNHVPGGNNLIRVRITARDATTTWVYLITCPGEKGSQDNPRACATSSAVTSGGAGVTDTYVDFGPNPGRIGVRYQMYNIPDKLDVFQNGTLIATTGGPVTGDHWLYFNYNPAGGTNCQIRVTGEGKTSWSFLHTCPQPDVIASVDNPSVNESNEGQTASLCWTIKLDKQVPYAVDVAYTTTGVSGFTPINGTVTFAPGETSKRVCGTVTGNNTAEGNRTTTMTISSTAATIQQPVGVGTIVDDDNALCKQTPTGQVYELPGSIDGAYSLFVQPDYNCAAGNTKYLMQAFLTFPETGAYVFNNSNDDNFELYIDCKLVASGPIGAKATTVNVTAGTRNVILRYENVPDCTPGYAAFSIRRNNQLIYITRAADWKGQANSIGEIEGDGGGAGTPPPTCDTVPEICRIYLTQFGRYPEEAGAQNWVNDAARRGINWKDPQDYETMRKVISRAASREDCAYMGGTWDATNGCTPP